jgi:UDP-N-acetylmuramate dehydrogenase
VTTRPQAEYGTAIEDAYPLARLTTVGIGGPARHFARPETVAELEQLLEWAAGRDVAVAVLGLGSNVLAADAGIDALVVKLTGELTRVEIDGERLIAGGGAANAVCLHRARAAGLGGMEFACAIPGTTGGGVRMNAGAYGRDWSDIVLRALVTSGAGTRWLEAEELDLGYRHSGLTPGDIVVRVEFGLYREGAEHVKALVRELNQQRKAAQPTNRRTFGSVFKNPDHEFGAGRMLDACGLKGFGAGGARISPRHANFIENVDDARATDAIALMAEARRRALDEFGVVLEQEVELLGDLELPPAGELPS